MSDKELILLLRSRPSEGLARAMDAYYKLVRTVCARILPRHPQDVEECVEDTFVSLWKSIDSVDPDTRTLKGYILITARNAAISRYRQLRRRDALPLDDLELACGDDVADLVSGADAGRQLRALVAEMPEPDREIFFRKYFLFESLSQIAQSVGLGEMQIKNRLYRGRQRLKKRLEERGIFCEAI